MFARHRKWLLALGLVGLLVVALLFVVVGRAPAPMPLPNPNGYNDFLQAASATLGDIGNYPTLDLDALRELVSTNAESLRLLRLGLTQQCAVPTEVTVSNTPAMMTDLAGMKRLAQLLAAEGRLRELDNQPVDAIRTYLDAMRFGNEMSRGGILITRLVGVAIEAIGRAPLAGLVPKLKADEARKLLAELEKIESTRVTWDEVQRGEYRYVRRQLRANPNPAWWAMNLWNLRSGMKRATDRNNRILAQERLLVAELALRCYQADKARAPARLDDLVPAYLSKLPQDPFTGRALVYRPQGTNWLLYSIGADGVDNGGRPAARGTGAPGDLQYNYP